MSDSFTEVTTKSWGSRIGESIKGVLFGLVLVVGSCIFLFWNEGRAVQTERSLTEGASLVVPVDPSRVDPANDGKLVHLSGDLKPGAPLTDPDFTVSATALRLARTVEMYQWKEESKSETRKNVGGSEETVTTYEYVRTWSDHASIPVASSGRRGTSIRKCSTAAHPIHPATRRWARSALAPMSSTSFPQPRP